MAEKTEIQIVDDLDDTKRADRRVIVGLDNEVAVLDLTAEHYEELAQFLKPYLAAGTRLQNLDLARQYTSQAVDRTAVRVWAHEQGIKTPSRGLVPANVLEQYLASGTNTQIMIGPIETTAATGA